MKPFARLMLMTLGFGLLAAVTGLVGPQPKSAQATTTVAAVAVVNTPGVNVANTPTVNSRQAGAWNVGINGTPNVNVANMPTVNLAPGTTVGVTGGTFNFSNTPATPIFTRDKDNPALMPFQTTLCTGTACGTGPFSFQVPAGQRAVIEYVSEACGFTGGSFLSGLVLDTTVGGVSAAYQPSLLQPDPFVPGHFVTNQQVRIYASPGSTINLFSNLVGSGATCFVILSGYMVAP